MMACSDDRSNGGRLAGMRGFYAGLIPAKVTLAASKPGAGIQYWCRHATLPFKGALGSRLRGNDAGNRTVDGSGRAGFALTDFSDFKQGALVF